VPVDWMKGQLVRNLYEFTRPSGYSGWFELRKSRGGEPQSVAILGVAYRVRIQRGFGSELSGNSG